MYLMASRLFKTSRSACGCLDGRLYQRAGKSGYEEFYVDGRRERMGRCRNRVHIAHGRISGGYLASGPIANHMNWRSTYSVTH